MLVKNLICEVIWDQRAASGRGSRLAGYLGSSPRLWSVNRAAAAIVIRPAGGSSGKQCASLSFAWITP